MKKRSVLKLDDSWIYKTIVLANLISRQVASTVQVVSGLNLSQWRVMAALADNPGRTASEVVDVTPMDKGIVSRAVKTLVNEKIVERRASEDDGRLSHLFLTTKGKSLYQKIVDEMDQNGTSGRNSIDSDVQTSLLSALDRTIQQYTERNVNGTRTGPQPTRAKH